MTRQPSNRTPQYIKTILDALASGKMHPSADGINHIHIYHDDDCAIYQGGDCDCSPEVIQEIKGRKADQ